MRKVLTIKEENFDIIEKQSSKKKFLTKTGFEDYFSLLRDELVKNRVFNCSIKIDVRSSDDIELLNIHLRIPSPAYFSYFNFDEFMYEKEFKHNNEMQDGLWRYPCVEDFCAHKDLSEIAMFMMMMNQIVKIDDCKMIFVNTKTDSRIASVLFDKCESFVLVADKIIFLLLSDFFEHKAFKTSIKE